MVVIIVIVLVVAAFVFYYMRSGDLGPLPGVTQSDDVMKLQKQGIGDDVASIEKDLQSTDLNNLSAESSAIDKELAAPATQ